MKFKTPWNAEEFPRKYEENHSPSLTVPDQSMSIKEIIERHSRGLSTTGIRVPMYEGEDDILEGVDMRTLDLSERVDIVNAKSDELFNLKNKINESKIKKSGKVSKTVEATQLEITDKPIEKDTPQ